MSPNTARCCRSCRDCRRLQVRHYSLFPLAFRHLSSLRQCLSSRCCSVVPEGDRIWRHGVDGTWNDRALGAHATARCAATRCAAAIHAPPWRSTRLGHSPAYGEAQLSLRLPCKCRRDQAGPLGGRSEDRGVVRDSNSGHQLLLPPANRCPIFASWTMQRLSWPRSMPPTKPPSTKAAG